MYIINILQISIYLHVYLFAYIHINIYVHTYVYIFLLIYLLAFSVSHKSMRYIKAAVSSVLLDSLLVFYLNRIDMIYLRHFLNVSINLA